jgi:hypothetical protein
MHDTAHIGNAFLMEVILTFILVYVIFATAFDTVDTKPIKIDAKGTATKGDGSGMTIYVPISHGRLRLVTQKLGLRRYQSALLLDFWALLVDPYPEELLT